MRREIENFQENITEVKRITKSRSNSFRQRQPLPEIEEVNEVEQFRVEDLFERNNIEENSESSESEEEENNNQEENCERMDLLSFKLPRFNGDGIQDPEEWLKEFEKVVIMN